MADISDLMNSLANAVTNIVYPQMKYDAGGATWDKTGQYDTPASTAPVAVNQFDTGSNSTRVRSSMKRKRHRFPERPSSSIRGLG
jgi:hypothetical protein